MLLSELGDVIITETGQYLLGELTDDFDTLLGKLKLDMEKFWGVTKHALFFYGRHRPFSRRTNIEIVSGTYVYTSAGTYGIPTLVPRCVPVSSANVQDIIAADRLRLYRNTGEATLLEIPSSFSFRYESPTLYASRDGTMDVTEHYDHVYAELDDSEGALQDVNMTTITEKDHYFKDLAKARFLETVGRGRRAFVLEEQAIVLDSAEMVSEGADLWRETVEALEEKGNKWWHAISGT